MTAPLYQTGDVVQLKSGGPKMTVICNIDTSALDETNTSRYCTVRCYWFDATLMPKIADFAEATLVKGSAAAKPLRGG